MASYVRDCTVIKQITANLDQKYSKVQLYYDYIYVGIIIIMQHGSYKKAKVGEGGGEE